MPLGSFCCALNCINGPLVRPSKKDPSLPAVACHRFPTDLSVREQWVKAIGKGNYIPKKQNFLCSEHFVEDDFHFSNDNLEGPYQRYQILKKNAVPSIFNEFKPSEGEIILVPKQTEDSLQASSEETCSTEEVTDQFLTSPVECNVLIQEGSSKIAIKTTPKAAGSSLLEKQSQRKQIGEILLESIVTAQNGHDYCVGYNKKRKKSSNMVSDPKFDQSTSSDSEVITGETRPSLKKDQAVFLFVIEEQGTPGTNLAENQGGYVNQNNHNTGAAFGETRTNLFQENQPISTNSVEDVVPCEDDVQGGHGYNKLSTSHQRKPPKKKKTTSESVQADLLNIKSASTSVNNAKSTSAENEKPESCPSPQGKQIGGSPLKGVSIKKSQKKETTEKKSNKDCIKCKKLLIAHSIKVDSYRRSKKLMKSKVNIILKRLKRRGVTLEKLKNKIKMMNQEKPRVFEEKIKENLSGIAFALIWTQVINKDKYKTSRFYCQEVKEFALNLHSISIKSYNYMKSVGFILPSSSQVRNWNVKLKSQEGIVNDTASELSEFVQFKNKTINNACDLLESSVIDEEEIADVTHHLDPDPFDLNTYYIEHEDIS